MKKIAIVCLLVAVGFAVSTQYAGTKTADYQLPGPTAPTTTA